MTAKQMAFGNRLNAQWVNAPMKGLQSPIKGSTPQRTLSNGQMTLRRSLRYRKGFEFVFKGTEAALMSIKDYADGGYGVGPWLFLNPRSMNGNILPMTWSQPELALGARGNQALDLYTGPVSFSGTVKQNPHKAPATVTGLTGAPANGAKLWSPNNSLIPVAPAATGSRPFQTFLIPPKHGARLTVWGSQNTGNSPGIYYAVSNVGPANTTVGAGTDVNPTLAGTSVAIALDANNWRVIDIWIGAGATFGNTDWTIFMAMDLRLLLNATPAQPTVFDRGRGQFPVDFSEDEIHQTLTRVGATDAQTFYEIDPTMEEVSSPW